MSKRIKYKLVDPKRSYFYPLLIITMLSCFITMFVYYMIRNIVDAAGEAFDDVKDIFCYPIIIDEDK